MVAPKAPVVPCAMIKTFELLPRKLPAEAADPARRDLRRASRVLAVLRL